MIPGWPIETGPHDDPSWVDLESLATDRFAIAEACFTATAASQPGLDRRGQGAFFIGGVAYYFSFALAWQHLTTGVLPALTARHLAVRPGPDRTLLYRVRPAEAGAIAAGPLIEAALAPLIAQVKLATRLSDPAQWRLVADGIVGGYIAVGQHLGQIEAAWATALALVRDPRWRFFNGHTDVYEIDGQCFLKRGGCCRYYTADAGSYCATCILRPPDQHIGEIRRRYLAAAE